MLHQMPKENSETRMRDSIRERDTCISFDPLSEQFEMVKKRMRPWFLDLLNDLKLDNKYRGI